ncbi:MAG: virulence RhuM family protein [Paludibacteraceae bacterium]|nr:virulence RhuM family protein [Paludibacteraceae bacterium]
MNEIVLYQPDARFQLEVQLKNETVWLNLQQLSLLFDRDRTVIARHIRNVYAEKELEENITCAKFAHMGSDGDQTYETKYYNLDVIISVGYRVKSQRGVQFRQWATRILKEYMLKGYAANQRLLNIENQLAVHQKQLAQHQEQLDFFVRTSLPPVEQVFFEGQFFEARVLLEKLIKMAKKRVIIIDGYIDAATFEMLDVRAKGVTADIYSDSEYKTLRDAHNASKGKQPVFTHKWSKSSHDRWVIIDDTLYHCGHSVKDLGKKLSAIMRMDLNPEVILKEVR